MTNDIVVTIVFLLGVPLWYVWWCYFNIGSIKVELSEKILFGILSIGTVYMMLVAMEVLLELPWYYNLIAMIAGFWVTKKVYRYRETLYLFDFKNANSRKEYCKECASDMIFYSPCMCLTTFLFALLESGIL